MSMKKKKLVGGSSSRYWSVGYFEFDLTGLEKSICTS